MRTAACLAMMFVPCAAEPGFAQQKKPEVVAKLEGHRGGVSAIAYSARGDRIATGSGNGVVRLWDAKTGELVSRVDDGKHSSARVTSVAFSADGRYLSSSSRTMTGAWDLSDPKRLALRYEDPYGPEPGKLGIVSGDGRQVYFTGIENAAPVLSIYSFGNRTITKADLPAKLKPNAIAAISDAESALVAVHCAAGEKGETAAVALVGLGETRLLTKDVPPVIAAKPVSIGFAPDAKWLVVGNGSRVACWRVPGSQVITGDPKLLPGNRNFVAAAGPRNLVAAATEPAADRTVLVTLFDLSGTASKPLAEYDSGLERISALAFSPDGSILAVGDDAEGVVQLWALR
jgi:WD40 repeat protein